MIQAKIFIEMKILILLFAGKTDRNLIEKHRRLRDFLGEDHDRLLELMNSLNTVVVTPSTLTEASNFLAQQGGPDESQIFHTLKLLIVHAEELLVLGRTAKFKVSSSIDSVSLTQ